MVTTRGYGLENNKTFHLKFFLPSMKENEIIYCFSLIGIFASHAFPATPHVTPFHCSQLTLRSHSVPLAKHPDAREEVHHGCGEDKNVPYLMTVKPVVEMPREQLFRPLECVDKNPRAVEQKHQCETAQKRHSAPVERGQKHQVHRREQPTRCHGDENHDTDDLKFRVIEEVEKWANDAGAPEDTNHG